MRLMVRWLSILTVLLAAACESAVIEPTATAPSTLSAPTLTILPPTAAPTRVPVAEATAFFGRSVPPGRSAATLRITHTAQQGPTLDIYLDGAEYLRSLGQGLSTGLTPVLPGDYTLHIEPRGEDVTLAEAPITLTAGQVTDVIVIAQEGALHLVVVNGPEETVDPGIGLVRTVNALPGGESVQIVINDSTVSEALAHGESTEPLRFEEGDLAVSMLFDGTEFLSEQRRVRELTYLLLVITGSADRPELTVHEAPLLSRYTLRVINASEEAREIDVYFDGALAAANLGYGAATERTLYANAPATVSVHAANADLAVSTPLLAGYTINPRAGADATLAIYGNVDDLRAMWIEQDLSPVPVGQSRLVFAHVLPETRSVRAGIHSEEIEELQPFAYGGASEPILLNAGELRLFFSDAASGGGIVELHQALPIEAGKSIIYFVTGIQVGEETPPLMLDEAVHEDETLSTEPVEPVRGVYRVRFVNIIVSQPLIDIEHDGQAVATNLRYGEGTGLIRVNAESVIMNAHMSTSGAVLVDDHIDLPRPGDYTIYIVGTPENGISAALIDDQSLPLITSTEQAPTVRLVNLTRDSSAIFGLALVPIRAAETAPIPTVQPTPLTSGQNGIDLGRRRLPIGIPIPIVGVEGIGASRQILTQTRAQTYVINRENEIIADLGAIEYDTGTHTDIVVYEYRTETEILAAAFPLVYPPR